MSFLRVSSLPLLARIAGARPAYLFWNLWLAPAWSDRGLLQTWQRLAVKIPSSRRSAILPSSNSATAPMIFSMRLAIKESFPVKVRFSLMNWTCTPLSVCSSMVSRRSPRSRARRSMECTIRVSPSRVNSRQSWSCGLFVSLPEHLSVNTLSRAKPSSWRTVFCRIVLTLMYPIFLPVIQFLAFENGLQALPELAGQGEAIDCNAKGQEAESRQGEKQKEFHDGFLARRGS